MAKVEIGISLPLFEEALALIEKLIEQFSELDDPRCPAKVEYRLVDILVIAVCAVIACAQSWEDITLYGRSKLS